MEYNTKNFQNAASAHHWSSFFQSNINSETPYSERQKAERLASEIKKLRLSLNNLNEAIIQHQKNIKTLEVRLKTTKHDFENFAIEFKKINEELEQINSITSSNPKKFKTDSKLIAEQKRLTAKKESMENDKKAALKSLKQEDLTYPQFILKLEAQVSKGMGDCDNLRVNAEKTKIILQDGILYFHAHNYGKRFDISIDENLVPDI